jgi:hypothetical protein
MVITQLFLMNYLTSKNMDIDNLCGPNCICKITPMQQLFGKTITDQH